MIGKILLISAKLKWIEIILRVFDEGDERLSLKEIRKRFFEESGIKKPFKFLDQNYGIIKLMPLLFIKEIYKNEKKVFTEDIKKIKIIRDSIAHCNFDFDEKGYLFKSDKAEVRMSYKEFVEFLHRIENEFHNERFRFD